MAVISTILSSRSFIHSSASGTQLLIPSSVLFLGRKATENLESILKSRDVTLPTKVCLVKAMVFIVVTYGCENWTIKKAEHRRIDAELEKTLEESLGLQGDPTSPS